MIECREWSGREGRVNTVLQRNTCIGSTISNEDGALSAERSLTVIFVSIMTMTRGAFVDYFVVPVTNFWGLRKMTLKCWSEQRCI